MCFEVPRSLTTIASTSITSRAVMLRRTTIASDSLVYSSIIVNIRSCRPSLVRSETKS
jgi:hypothetical protein